MAKNRRSVQNRRTGKSVPASAPSRILKPGPQPMQVSHQFRNTAMFGTDSQSFPAPHGAHVIHSGGRSIREAAVTHILAGIMANPESATSGTETLVSRAFEAADAVFKRLQDEADEARAAAEEDNVDGDDSKPCCGKEDCDKEACDGDGDNCDENCEDNAPDTGDDGVAEEEETEEG